MKYIFIFILSLLPIWLLGQNITTGSSTALRVGSRAFFYSGGDAVYNGTITNEGTISANQDVNFNSNNQVGNLRFIGLEDQQLLGDSVVAANLVMDKADSRLLLDSDRVIVTDTLDMVSGIIEADDIEDIFLEGNSELNGTGYINGAIIASTQSESSIVLPVGLNQNPNYLTISSNETGKVIGAQCVLPNPETLNPSEFIVGIADEVEWQLFTLNDTATVQVTLNFNGIDLSSFSNGAEIRADTYLPAIVLYNEVDTLFYPLTTSNPGDLSADQSITSGRIVSSDFIGLNATPRRLAIGWTPQANGPIFFIPNAFAPYGEQIENRVFRPYFAGGNVTSINMRIFDSFDVEVYEVSQQGEDIDLEQLGWNGRVNGVDVPEGVYYYTIVLEVEGEDQPRTKEASVLLVK